MTNANHDPRPEFLGHLAWQTRTALRREERFARPTRGALPGWSGKLRTLALVAASVLGGAATVVAAERLQDRREAELLLAGVEVRIETAALRLDHARVEADRSRALHEAGVIPDTEISGLEAEAGRAEEELRRLELDRAEIMASGRGPRDDLAAPLAGGRDYVSERLDLGAAGLREALDAARRRAERIGMLHATGLVPDGTVREAELEAALVERDLSLLEQRLRLRHEHLAGATSPEQVELLGMRAETLARAEQAGLRLDNARRTHELLEERVRSGLVNSSEARRSELELREVEAELRLTQLELARIDERLGR